MESTGELLKIDVKFPKNWASAVIINLFYSHLLALSSGDDLLKSTKVTVLPIVRMRQYS